MEVKKKTSKNLRKDMGRIYTLIAPLNVIRSGTYFLKNNCLVI